MRKIGLSLALILVAISIAVVWTFLGQKIPVSRADDDIKPPEITDISVLQLNASSTVITWHTDEASDSMINYGLDKDYGVLRSAYLTSTSHQITVSNLMPGYTYFYRVISSDAAGNQAISADYSFSVTGTKPKAPEKTAPTPTPPPETKPGEMPNVPDDIFRILDKITDPDLLRQIADRIEELAQKLFAPVSIIGSPKVEVGVDAATITWDTDKDSNSLINFAAEGEYNYASPDPYRSTQGQPYEYVTHHVVKVVGLAASTVYHYQIYSKPELGPEGKTRDDIFKTKAQLPEIRNVAMKKVEETAATIAWTTNVPTSALVDYTNLLTREVKTVGSPVYVTSHTLQLTNLIYKTPYLAVVRAESEAGDRVESRPLTFTTVKDELPPVISRVGNESTLYPGADTKVQTIISWETDEISKCQFFYHEGIAQAAGDSFPEEEGFVTKHTQVITTFSPSTIYKFWLSCADQVGNKDRSDDFVLFTPEKEKSIIDIILENFSSTFGWVKNIGKK